MEYEKRNFSAMNFLVRLFISTLAVLITAYLLPGVKVNGFLTAILVAAVIGILNVIVKPILILFSLPAIIFSFGLFFLVINVVIIFLADKLIDGFHVNGFWQALLFSIVLWLVNGILKAIQENDERR